jgi:hypothetical protein
MLTKSEMPMIRNNFTQTNLLAVSSIFFMSFSSSPGWNPLALAQRICLTADNERLTFPMVGFVVCLTGT